MIAHSRTRPYTPRAREGNSYYAWRRGEDRYCSELTVLLNRSPHHSTGDDCVHVAPHSLRPILVESCLRHSRRSLQSGSRMYQMISLTLVSCLLSEQKFNFYELYYRRSSCHCIASICRCVGQNGSSRSPYDCYDVLSGLFGKLRILTLLCIPSSDVVRLAGSNQHRECQNSWFSARLAYFE